MDSDSGLDSILFMGWVGLWICSFSRIWIWIRIHFFTQTQIRIRESESVTGSADRIVKFWNFELLGSGEEGGKQLSLHEDSVARGGSGGCGGRHCKALLRLASLLGPPDLYTSWCAVTCLLVS